MSRCSRRGSAAAGAVTAAHLSTATAPIVTSGESAMAIQLVRTEKVVRAEAERREAKARMYLYDRMISLVKDQLLCVSQLKEQWVEYKTRQEDERQVVVEQERDQRTRLQASYATTLSELCRDWAD